MYTFTIYSKTREWEYATWAEDFNQAATRAMDAAARMNLRHAVVCFAG